MPEFAVLVRSKTGKASSIGAHAFSQPLVEGDKVSFQGETWIVVEIRAEETPPVAVLQLPESRLVS